jgi:hypothetical protein
VVPWSGPAFLLVETSAGPRASGEVGRRLPLADLRTVAPKNKKATSRLLTRRLHMTKPIKFSCGLLFLSGM